jgi:rhodanese-related sulfurtransferase
MKEQAARIIIQILFAVALCLFFTAPATSTPNVTEGNPDTSLLVDADYVQRYKRRNPELQLVDVRSAKAFDETHIPGSLHVPLGLVPHKESLQSDPVVLLGSGAEPGPLLRICRELRQKGVQASVMWGGLVAWRETDGRLTGSLKDRQALNEVAPAAYYRQRRRDYWRVLYVGDERPQKLDIALPEAEVAQRDGLGSHLENGSDPRLILLVTRKGEGYDRLIRVIHEKNIRNIFCLQGGINGYMKHFRVRRDKQDQETAKNQNCNECIKVKQGCQINSCYECR